MNALLRGAGKQAEERGRLSHGNRLGLFKTKEMDATRGVASAEAVMLVADSRAETRFRKHHLSNGVDLI